MGENTTCRLCGAQLEPTFRFCPLCGKMREQGKVAASGITLREAYLSWLPTREASISAKSMGSYRRAWARVEGYANCDISKVHPEEIQLIINKLNYEDAKKLRSLLCQMYDIANTKSGGNINPMGNIKLPKRKIKRREAFTPQEIEQIWSLYRDGDTDAAYPLLLIYTGMRSGELFALREENIDFESKTISGVGTKNEASVTEAVILPKAIIPVLQQLCIGEPHRHIMPYANSASYYKHYYAILDRANVRCLPPHCCRHTLASMLARRNVMPIIVQRAMRHSDYQTTAEVYTHLDPGYVHDVLDTLT